ncbi:MAG TPA: hypothetical protein VJ982_09240 [Gemmatimonadota bacterium]|nr:hypothetical protein [Gemmatimonadota bacterium]
MASLLLRVGSDFGFRGVRSCLGLVAVIRLARVLFLALGIYAGWLRVA